MLAACQRKIRAFENKLKGLMDKYHTAIAEEERLIYKDITLAEVKDIRSEFWVKSNLLNGEELGSNHDIIDAYCSLSRCREEISMVD